jgi:hypothetical protein
LAIFFAAHTGSDVVTVTVTNRFPVSPVIVNPNLTG